MSMMISTTNLGPENLNAYKEALDVIGRARALGEELIPLDRVDDSFTFANPSKSRDATYDWNPAPGRVMVGPDYTARTDRTRQWFSPEDWITAELGYEEKGNTKEMTHLKAVIDSSSPEDNPRTLTMDTQVTLQTNVMSQVYTDSLKPGLTYRMMPDGTISIETEQ